MAFIDFSLPPGIVRAATKKLAPGRYIDSNLIRFRQSVLAPIGGWTRMTATPLDGVPRAILGWNSQADLRYLSVFTTNKLYYLLSDQIADITPDGYQPPETSTLGGYSSGPFGDATYGDARLNVEPWFQRPPLLSLDSWGDQLIATSSSDGRILRFDPSDPTMTKAIPITKTGASNVPGSVRQAIVSPERHVIVLQPFGEPRTVAWSSSEDYGNWDFTDPTSSAGSLPVDTHGYLQAMGTCADGTIIWSDTDLFRLRYVGAPYYYGIDKIIEGTSLLSPYAHCEYQGKSFYVTREGFAEYSAGVVKPILSDLQDWFTKDIDPIFGRRTTCVVQNHLFDELYIFYPQNGSAENDSYLCYNHVEGHWTKGRLARSCGIPALIGDKPYWCDPSGDIWEHETGTAFTSHGVSPGDIFVETGAISMGKGQLATVTRVLSDTDLGAESTSWDFFTRMTPEGPEFQYSYTPRHDGFIDTRFTCRDVRIRVSQAQDGQWTMGSPAAEVKPRGFR